MKKYQDHYFKRAKQENYAARSVYKLQELDKRFQLLKKGMSVLDLGASPGSWTQWASKRVGPSGRVLAVDLKEQGTGFDPNVTYLVADAFSEDPAMLDALKDHAPLGLVLSDMAPKTTGVKFADQARSLELCERALELALAWLAPGGNLAVKIFEGPDVHGFMTGMRAHFDKVKGFKPKSSRSESKETFIAGLGFRPGTE